ncbi:MAG: protein translocase subunit SecF [Nitrospirae bacterium]|nr:protein translocase subunit SecF [Nitrospirota bacterium]
MEIIKPGTNINFVGKIKYAIAISVIVIAIGIGAMMLKGGLNYGIDFAGGTLVELRFKSEPSIDNVRNSLKKIELGDSIIQQFGDPKDILIRVEKSSESLEGIGEKIKKVIEGDFQNESIEIKRVEMVGPQVGKELQWQAMMAVFYSMIGIAIYVAWRFQFKWGIAAIIALAHDVLITIGILAITGKEFSLPVLAAVLTVVGYSINDTIVIFDRIRENMRLKSKESFESIINISINETLSRTFLTVLTVLVVLLALFIYGGEIIHDFAFTMLVGVSTGTFSSVYIAAPVLIFWKEKKK